MATVLSKTASNIVSEVKKKYGLGNQHLSPLLNHLELKSEATKELYLIVFKKWLEAGGVFDADTALKVLKQYKPNSRSSIFYALKFIYKCYGEELPLQMKDIGVKSVRRHKEIMSPEEVKQVIHYVKNNETPYNQFLFVLSSVYGLRRVEMFRLEKSDIELDNRTFFVFTAKGGEAREHLIPEILVPYFEGYIKSKKPKYRYITEMNFLFDTIVDKAGVQLRKRLGWHSIRRCLVTELMKTDVNPMIIRNFLRWKPRSSDILMEYTLYNPHEVDRKIFEVHPFLKEWEIP